MAAAEKPADTGRTSDRTNAVRRNKSGVDNSEMFSALLLMLSAQGDNNVIPKDEGLGSLSAGLNHDSESQDADVLQSELTPLTAQLRDAKLQKTHLLQSDSLSPGNLLRTHNERSDDDRTDNGLKDENGYSPVTDIPMFAMDGPESFMDAPYMKLLREASGKQSDNAADTSTDVKPEIIPNMHMENPGGNVKAAAHSSSHNLRTGVLTQLADKLADMYFIGGHSARIRLQPEELGNMHIDISVADDGIKAIVTVEEKLVKDMLESNLDTLVDELKKSGLNIDQFTVNVSYSGYDGSMPGWFSDRGRRDLSDDMPLTDLPYDDAAACDTGGAIIGSGANSISIFV
ncbi:MAG: flagellar hook-length control protein FliK [Nitrospirae bacterium]|nr:flagellar hook-length control protein FliK [Nitrospirota bacterium]